MVVAECMRARAQRSLTLMQKQKNSVAYANTITKKFNFLSLSFIHTLPFSLFHIQYSLFFTLWFHTRSRLFLIQETLLNTVEYKILKWHGGQGNPRNRSSGISPDLVLTFNVIFGKKVFRYFFCCCCCCS